MGRKKRKADSSADDESQKHTTISDVGDANTADEVDITVISKSDTDVPSVVVKSLETKPAPESMQRVKVEGGERVGSKNKAGSSKLNEKSGYAVTSHSGEIVHEDLYVSDGSEDSDGEENVEVVLVGSRMGIMRRGFHQLSAALQQPNRQWTRQQQQGGSADQQKGGGDNGDGTNASSSRTGGVGGGVAVVELTEEEKLKQEEEELAKLDPAQRAARLLQEKQRKMEEAKEEARRKENEENASRDPGLFSKRTAFDIRFDQIDDKPWTRGSGDVSDFFNYGMDEESWLEYAEQQLLVRQELIDSNRQKRPPDPSLVPVQPHRLVAAARSSVDDADEKYHTDSEGGSPSKIDHHRETDGSDGTDAPVIGPTFQKDEDTTSSKNAKIDDDNDDDVSLQLDIGEGGAWGAGAPPGSVLAKLIQESQQQQQQQQQDSADATATATDDNIIAGNDNKKNVSSPSIVNKYHDGPAHSTDKTSSMLAEAQSPPTATISPPHSGSRERHHHVPQESASSHKGLDQECSTMEVDSGISNEKPGINEYGQKDHLRTRNNHKSTSTKARRHHHPEYTDVDVGDYNRQHKDYDDSESSNAKDGDAGGISADATSNAGGRSSGVVSSRNHGRHSSTSHSGTAYSNTDTNYHHHHDEYYDNRRSSHSGRGAGDAGGGRQQPQQSTGAYGYHHHPPPPTSYPPYFPPPHNSHHRPPPLPPAQYVHPPPPALHEVTGRGGGGGGFRGGRGGRGVGGGPGGRGSNGGRYLNNSSATGNSGGRGGSIFGGGTSSIDGGQRSSWDQKSQAGGRGSSGGAGPGNWGKRPRDDGGGGGVGGSNDPRRRR